MWTAETKLSENADPTSNYAVAGSIAVTIEASAQDSKKVRRANAFDIRFSSHSEDADTFVRFLKH